MSIRVFLFACVLATPGMAQDVGDTVEVDTEQLNARSGPGTGNAPLGRLRQGDVRIVAEREGDWVRLRDALDRDVVTGWVNRSFLRVMGQGGSAPTPSAAPARRSDPVPRRTAPRKPFRISNTSFDCDESFVRDGGLDSCELAVDVAVHIPAVYGPFLADSVSVTCEGEVSYETADGVMPRSEHGSDYSSISLFGGSGTASLWLNFDFGYTVDPVVSAKVTYLDCFPD